jgi:hypothetical protein
MLIGLKPDRKPTKENKMTNSKEIISLRILALLTAGLTMQQAFDAVMGKGAYAKIAGEVYDALRAK